MRHFSLTDLNTRTGEIAEAAARAPVGITRRGKTRYVLMAIEDYEALRRTDPRRVYGQGETPPEIAEPLAAGLERFLAEAGDDD